VFCRVVFANNPPNVERGQVEVEVEVEIDELE
jgi:hypothetical protein